MSDLHGDAGSDSDSTSGDGSSSGAGNGLIGALSETRGEVADTLRGLGLFFSIARGSALKHSQQAGQRGSREKSLRLHHPHSARFGAGSGIAGSAHVAQSFGITSALVTPTLNVLRQRAHLLVKTLAFSIAHATVGAALAVLDALDVLAGRLGGGDGMGEDTGVTISSHE